MDEPAHLLQTLLVMSFSTEVNDVSCQTCHATWKFTMFKKYNESSTKTLILKVRCLAWNKFNQVLARLARSLELYLNIQYQLMFHTFTICWARPLFSLLVQTVEGVDGVVIQLTVNLTLQLSRKPGAKPHSGSLGEISLNKNFSTIGLGKCCGGGIVGHRKPKASLCHFNS